jgi:hypothetical protein
MATFSFADADNYGQANSGSFFSLKDDGDTGRIRFMYRGIEDVQGYAVHQVDVGDKKRYVNCLRTYNDPIDMCPLCQAQYKVMPKLFLKVYNEDAGEAQIWERGKTYFQRIASMAARYKPLCNEIIEVQRNGKKGDMKTTYEFFPIESTDFDLDNTECSEPLGTIILDKTAQEMDVYLNTGSFPDDGTDAVDNRREEITRRTPTNPGRRAF